jgi:hypothetical protein
MTDMGDLHYSAKYFSFFHKRSMCWIFLSALACWSASPLLPQSISLPSFHPSPVILWQILLSIAVLSKVFSTLPSHDLTSSMPCSRFVCTCMIRGLITCSLSNVFFATPVVLLIIASPCIVAPRTMAYLDANWAGFPNTHRSTLLCLSQC